MAGNIQHQPNVGFNQPQQQQLHQQQGLHPQRLHPQLQQLQQQQLQQQQQQIQDLEQRIAAIEKEKSAVKEYLTKEKRKKEHYKQECRLRTLPAQNLPWAEYSNNHRSDKKKAIHEVLSKVLRDLSIDFTDIKLTCEVANHKQLVFQLRGSAGLETSEKEKRKEFTRRILEVKDIFRISYKALQALRTGAGLSDIPPTAYIHSLAKELASNIDIIPLGPRFKDGCMRKVQDIITYILDLPQNKRILQTELNTVTITLRFACDGAKITKAKDSVRAVCKYIPEEDMGRYNRKMSPEDELTLFMYMGKEDRDTLEIGSRQTFLEMNIAATTGFLVHGKTVKVKWILCSDWKNLAIVRGINQANSTFFCLWCHCTKRDIKNFNMHWTTDRSPEMQAEGLQGHTMEDQKGYVKRDLMDFIPYNMVCPDELHLRMRITGKLFNQVVVWCIAQNNRDGLKEEMKRIKVPFEIFEKQGDDGKGSTKHWTQCSGDQLQTILSRFDIFNILDNQEMDLVDLMSLNKAILVTKLEEKSGRTIPAKTKKEFVVYELAQLLSPEEKEEFYARNYKPRSRFGGAGPGPDAERAATTKRIDPAAIKEVWDDFGDLMQRLKQRHSPEEARSFHTAAKEWSEKFRKATFDEEVIPYIHALVYHVPEALEKFKFLPDIGVTQLERKNYDHHLHYATSRQGYDHHLHYFQTTSRQGYDHHLHYFQATSRQGYDHHLHYFQASSRQGYDHHLHYFQATSRQGYDHHLHYFQATSRQGYDHHLHYFQATSRQGYDHHLHYFQATSRQGYDHHLHYFQATSRQGYDHHLHYFQATSRQGYDHHLHYFQATSRQGGKQRKMATLQVMEMENRRMHFRKCKVIDETDTDTEDENEEENDVSSEEEDPNDFPSDSEEDE